MNRNYDYMYIPRGHYYYMSAFRWIPTCVEYPPRQPTSTPPQPFGTTGIYYSGTYLTPYKYDTEANGGHLSQEVDITLKYVMMW
jgi:hypothetical protein